ELFREFHALEFSDLRIPIFPTIERQAYLPWPRKHGVVLDRRFVVDVIGVSERVALDDMHVLAHEISCSIEPALTVQPRDIDNQRVAFPATIRCAHPCIDGGLARLSNIDYTIGGGILIRDRDVFL